MRPEALKTAHDPWPGQKARHSRPTNNHPALCVIIVPASLSWAWALNLIIPDCGTAGAHVLEQRSRVGVCGECQPGVPRLQQPLRVIKRHSGGRRLCKPAGTSQSLDVTARERAGGVLPSGHRKVTRCPRRGVGGRLARHLWASASLCQARAKLLDQLVTAHHAKLDESHEPRMELTNVRNGHGRESENWPNESRCIEDLFRDLVIGGHAGHLRLHRR